MINVPENELFSAYLDGELSAEEQAEVEQLLATSPAARQFMDELRAISAGLQALPTRRLQADLSDKVLREAERRILGHRPDLRSQVASDESGNPDKASGFRRFFRFRNFFWPGLAVAVAVMLMVSEHRTAPRDPVVVAPGTPTRDGPRTPPSIRAIAEPSPPGQHADAERPARRDAAGVQPAISGPADALPAAEPSVATLDETVRPGPEAAGDAVVSPPAGPTAVWRLAGCPL